MGSATGPTAFAVGIARFAMTATATVKRMIALIVAAVMPTVVLPTTTPPTSALEGRTTGTRTCSTAPSTGTATQRGGPTSSVPTGLSTRRARSSATIRTGLTVEVGLPVTAVTRTASSIFPKLLFFSSPFELQCNSLVLHNTQQYKCRNIF